MEHMTTEQVQQFIHAARDSVFVINEQLTRLVDTPMSEEIKGNITRNVEHLKIVVAKQEVIDSEEDISDLQAAIIAGEAAIVAHETT